MKKRKVLITGAAGYIGSILTRLLLDKGYFVIGLDNLRFGGESLLELFNKDNFKFINADIRDGSRLDKIVKDISFVIHLAAIVGDPACRQEPELAKEVNLYASKELYEIANKKGVERFIFASTCSNYGKMVDNNGYVSEESPLKPVSLYAKTKVEVEKYLLEQNRDNACLPVILRFATVYGISPRMRFDLTVNEFTRELALGKELVIYGEQFWRPYCHVVDLARSVVLAIESPKEKVAFDVFNVGDTSENYQKKMIVSELLKFFPKAKIKYVYRDEDPRDYRVSFEKIKKRLGFKITKRVSDGILQIKKALEKGLKTNPYDSRYKNV